MSGGGEDEVQFESEEMRRMLSKLTAIKETYYEGIQSKKVFFGKNKEKENCAVSVANQISIEEVMAQSFFTFPQRPDMFYMNYPIMKLYMNQNNYQSITDKLIQVLQTSVASGGGDGIEVHINLNGFTVSAAERYKHIIEYFSHKCNEDNIVLTPFIAHVYIYYAPSAMPSIISLLQLFIQPDILARMTLISKEDSPQALQALFA